MIKLFIKDVLTLISIFVNSVFFFFSGFAKRKKNRVILGSWGGHKISDNPRYLLDYLKEQEDLEILWCGRKHLKDNELFKDKRVKFIKYNSLSSFYYVLTAKYVFIANTYRDIAIINLFRGATIVQLWHGFGLKNTLATKRDNSFIKQLYYKIGRKSYEKCHHFISSSVLNTKKILDTFKFHDIKEEKIISCGQPKNDFLIRNNNMEFIKALKSKYKKFYNIPDDKKLVLYLPTFRDASNSFSFNDLVGEERSAVLKLLEKENAVIVEKMHFKHTENKEYRLEQGKIFTLQENIESQELLLISDILITDYSSCYLDFLVLDRPIVHFAYDYEQYKKDDRGFYYSLDTLAAGPITSNITETIKSLKASLREESYGKRREKIRKKAMNYESGSSCEQIVMQVIE